MTGPMDVQINEYENSIFKLFNLKGYCPKLIINVTLPL